CWVTLSADATDRSCVGSGVWNGETARPSSRNGIGPGRGREFRLSECRGFVKLLAGEPVFRRAGQIDERLDEALNQLPAREVDLATQWTHGTHNTGDTLLTQTFFPQSQHLLQALLIHVEGHRCVV